MKQFKLINNVLGWATFVIAMVVYALTAEETTSFWDCGEFIAVSHRLMVPHPPGAPFFLILGRVWSMIFSGGDPMKVAYAINLLSAASSAGAVMFCYWTIVLMGKRLFIGLKPTSDLSNTQAISLFAAGIVGALSFTFTDSFWFSAVEAEVYALSTFFTAFVFWAILKWDNIADEPGADKWIVLIAYMVGLSIGVHLLNLLCIPAIGLLYYFRRYEYKTSTLLLSLIISFGILGFIVAGIIPGFPSIAAKLEVFFVNSFGLPFGSGIIFFCLALVAGTIYGVLYSIKHHKHDLNLLMVSFIFIMIGYASYGVIVIRANFNPPINENNPSDVLSFVSYLKREQYGDRPLLYGPQFNAQPIKSEKSAPVFEKQGDKYVEVTQKMEQVYSPKDKALFPRMYSTQASHIQQYKYWVPKLRDDKKPTFGQNMNFFFKYQVGWMFIRYFMWNFSGRASDIQDSSFLLPWDSDAGIPETVATNKGRNQFYAIPLLLGIAGLFFHFNRKSRDAGILTTLFFFTGIAIILYTNEPPIEPRERDYTFAGAMFTFSVWIGFGVLALIDWLEKYISSATSRIAIVFVLSLSAPALMAKDGWDDHDRSGRWHTADSARNLLASCAKNAILFTGGDNDTFPVWYVQEVEGFRTDVRVINLSLLGTDWYIDQMKQKVRDSDASPISFSRSNYVQGTNDYIPFLDNGSAPNGMPLLDFIKKVEARDQSVRYMTQDGSGMQLSIMPTKTFVIPLDTAQLTKDNILPDFLKGRLVSEIKFNVNKGALFKNDLMVLDILAHNADFKRPVYFSSTLSNSSYLNLKEFMVLEGLAYRFLPAYTPGASSGVVNTEIMYNKMMKEFSYRGLDDSTRFFDENYLRFPLNLRQSFYRLAEGLIMEGKNDKAKEVVAKCFKAIPDAAIKFDPYTPQFIPVMLRLGQKAEAQKIAEVLARRAKEELDYYGKDARLNQQVINTALYQLQVLAFAYRNEKMEAESKKYEDLLNQYAYLSEQMSEAQYEEE